ncbi:MAG: hypothetical protein BWK80_36500 [Desulfobacteraceae bacterium IS3]|nr:MAG: hypothetical protein BWK80_36500 [Desulfobacteraceae bacterium IS3]
MAVKRYYLTEDDYIYFVRLFRNAEKLAWGYGDENASQPYCYIDIDLDNVSQENRAILGTDWKACSERLKRDAKTAPLPATAAKPDKSFRQAVIAEKAVDGGRKISGIIKPAALILFICLSAVFIIPGRISIRSDIQGGQKKNLDFMQLLQETVSSKPEKNNEARVKELLKRCQEHIRAKRLTEGEEGTALDCYREILRLSPGNAEAQAGLQSLETQYALWAKNALRGRNVEKARQYLEGLNRVNPSSPALAELKREISPSGASPELSNTGPPAEAADKPSLKKEADKPLLKKESKKPVPKKAKAKPPKKEKAKPPKKVKTKPSKKTQKRSGAAEDFTEMSLGTDFNQKRRK